VFSISIRARALICVGFVALSACAGADRKPDEIPASGTFYTVMAEIALARAEPHLAALEYTSAAEADATLWQRATEVAGAALQPTVALHAAAGWMAAEPNSLDARRAAGAAALALDNIELSARYYVSVISASPAGVEAEFKRLDTELRTAENVYGARRLADRLARAFPASANAQSLQGFAALRADDPAAAIKSLQAALARTGAGADKQDAGAVAVGDSGGGAASEARHELRQALLRARVLTGDAEAPLAELRRELERADTPANRLDYVFLLLAAQRDAPARAALVQLAEDSKTRPVALRVLGLIELREGNLDAAAKRFSELLATGRFVDDAFFYLGVIAERQNDLEKALRLYARVQDGENSVPALLRAAAILHVHGAAPAAEELLDQLINDEPGRAPEVWSARARMYADAGEMPQAFAAFDRGILQYPDSAALRFARAASYDEQGRTREALNDLQAIAAARPDDPAALNALGYTLADHARQLSRARALIARACAASPYNSAFRDSLGWVLYRQGRAADALPYLSAAYADDHNGEIAAHLGEVLWQLGKKSEAEQVWAAANKIDADNPLVKATRLRLHAAH
jgi:predicted Zn-dependent protease